MSRKDTLKECIVSGDYYEDENIIVEVLKDTLGNLMQLPRWKPLTNKHICISADGGTPNQKCLACAEDYTDITCKVCRTKYSSKGQHAGTVWGPGYHICKRCVQAGRDARRDRERMIMTEMEWIKIIKDVINDVVLPAVRAQVTQEVAAHIHKLRTDLNHQFEQFHLPEAK